MPAMRFIGQEEQLEGKDDIEAMHRREGYDVDAMYDVTRNTMMAQDIMIPYPDKYWTAEVFVDGFDKPSRAYMFSAEF